MIPTPDHADGVKAWLKRLWPLVLLGGAFALVFAMGWQRYLTLAELADRRDSLRALIAAQPLLSLLAYIGI